jgi:hypothetical protein
MYVVCVCVFAIRSDVGMGGCARCAMMVLGQAAQLAG